MMSKIIIDSQGAKLELQVDFLNNPASNKIQQSLPVESTVRLWGDEIYFDTAIDAPEEGATTDVEIKDLAYWPQGKCLCIFFGRTPMSTSSKPVPASSVVVIGKITSPLDKLREVKSGSKIRVE